MKNVKIFIALLVVAMATVFIYSCAKEGADQKTDNYSENSQTATRVAGLCGNPLEGQCDPDNIVTLPLVLDSVAGYPGCTFNVSVTYNDCLDDGDSRLFIGTDSITSYNCPQYDIDFAAALSAGGLTLQNFINNFEKSIYDATELELYDFYFPKACGSGKLFTITWFLESCVQRCIRFNREGGGYYTFETRSCGDACCIRYTEICSDTITHLPIVTSTTSPVNQSTNCTGNANFPLNNPKGRPYCDAMTSCSFRCE